MCYSWKLVTNHTSNCLKKLNTCGYVLIMLCPGIMPLLGNNKKRSFMCFTEGLWQKCTEVERNCDFACRLWHHSEAKNKPKQPTTEKIVWRAYEKSGMICLCGKFHCYYEVVMVVSPFLHTPLHCILGNIFLRIRGKGTIAFLKLLCPSSFSQYQAIPGQKIQAFITSVRPGATGFSPWKPIAGRNGKVLAGPLVSPLSLFTVLLRMMCPS